MESLQSRLFVTYVYTVLFIYIISSVIPSNLLNFADDLLFLAMLFNFLFFMRKKPIHFDFIIYTTLFIIIIFITYGLVNDGELLATLLYARYFKNFFLILIIASIHKACFEKVMRLTYIALAVSVPIAFYQFNTADMSKSSWWDEVGGVFGRDGHSGTLSLLILIYVAYEYFTRTRDGRPVAGLYLVFLLPMLINETKIIIFLIPVIFVVVSLVYGGRSVRRILLISPIFVVSMLIANSMYLSFFNYSLFSTVDYDFIESYFFIDELFAAQEIDIGRFMRLIYAHEYLANQGFSTLLFGEGLGATFYGQNSGVEGKLVSEFFVLRLHTGSRPQLYQMLLEFGYVGTILFALSLFLAWISVIKSNTRTNEETLAIITVPVFVFALAYQTVIESKAIVFLMCYSLSAASLNRFSRK